VIKHQAGSGGRFGGRRARPPHPAVARLSTYVGRTAAALRLAWSAAPGKLALAVTVELCSGVAPVASAWMIKMTLDRLVADAAGPTALLLGLGFAAIALVVAIGPPTQRYLQAELGRAVATRAKDDLYTVVRGFELLSTLEEPAFRDRLRLAEQSCQAGPGQVVTSLLGSVRAVVTLTGLLTTIAAIMPGVATLLVASAVPALMAETRLSRRRAGMLWRLSPTERREAFFTELLTSLSAAKETRLFGAGRVLHRRMLTEMTNANAIRRGQDRRELLAQSLLALLSGGLAGGSFVWMLVAADAGLLTAGDVGAVVVAIGTTLSAVAGLVGHLSSGHYAGLLLDHYLNLVGATPDLAEPVTAENPVALPHGAIELVDVWFRYSDDQPWVLRGVSFTIPLGRAVALVGENGSGKSTIVKLLCRFYDPTRGSIRWGGVDIRDLPVHELRRRIGAVFQDFMCYELTARDNIALGDADGRTELDLSPQRLTEAAEQAEATEALRKLPRGMDTLLSRTFVDYAGDADADGVLLSGGTWQRLALARALLRGDRDLLIMDEPSSGLDAYAEHRIHRRLADSRRGRSSVLVSHRLNTVRDADEILLLADGRIAERGTHQQLLDADGAYADLFRLQAAGYQESGPAADRELSVSGWPLPPA
jgi:ATP-binding cassette subfamily B protein